jgi:hypothetical protein
LKTLRCQSDKLPHRKMYIYRVWHQMLFSEGNRQHESSNTHIHLHPCRHQMSLDIGMGGHLVTCYRQTLLKLICHIDEIEGCVTTCKIRIKFHQMQQCFFNNKIKPLCISANAGHHQKVTST